MAVLQCDQMSVSLSTGGRVGSKTILHDISFDLQRGDRLALVGPNGAGKSTLLKVLAGIIHPSSGTLTVEGKISALFNIGFGLQRQSTGRTNMIMRNLMEGRSYKDIMKKLPEMIEFADIGEYIDRPMEVYSSGMAVRTVFSAATAFMPEVLLLDEWIGAGDMSFRQKSRERMQQLADASGIIVLATHRKKLSQEICNKGLYLRGGRVVMYGDVADIWEQYEADGGKRQSEYVPREEHADDGTSVDF